MWSVKIVSGLYKGFPLKTPSSNKTRPTQELVRKSLFDSLSFMLEESQCIDLFAGSGSIGLEALSRGAKEVHFVEKDKHALEALKANIRTLKVEKQSVIYPIDVFRWIEKQEKIPTYDFIFLDPPYELPIVSLIYPLLSLLNLEGSIILEQGKASPFSPPIEPFKRKKIGDTLLYFFKA